MKTYKEIIEKITELHNEADSMDLKSMSIKKRQNGIKRLEEILSQVAILSWVLTNTKLSEI